ncbi:hypothetical protein ACH470_37025 [Streptomyces bottropensis]|uniref:hypothetical protein n=1 Tax=Streptomyces bottropensis TaxID=42235 RepID=UPI0037892356
MIALPWVISRQNTEVFDGTQVADVVVGTVLVVLSGLSLLLLKLSERHDPDRGRKGRASPEPGRGSLHGCDRESQESRGVERLTTGPIHHGRSGTIVAAQSVS